MSFEQSTPYFFGDNKILHEKKPVRLSFGNFDGVHRGHQHLINTIKSNPCFKQNIPIVFVTFEPHTYDYFHPGDRKSLITGIDDKANLLLHYGIQGVFIQKFDNHFANISADDFCYKWLTHYFEPKDITLGHDFRYGKMRLGNFEHMKKFGEILNIPVQQVQPLKEVILGHSEIVSSSQIRQLISQGEMFLANKLLGHHFFMSGIITKGNQLGRQIGFPTANLKWEINYILPKKGVYCCLVEIEPTNFSDQPKLLPAVMNCGFRPSLGQESKLQIEAHIFNFDENIYNKKARFYPLHYLRSEERFQNLSALKEQISKDISNANNYFILNKPND